MKNLSTIITAVLASVVISSCQPPPAPPSTLCADFSTQPDNATPPPPFPPAFTEAGGHITFTQLGPTAPAMIFNDTAGEVGLRLSGTGLEISTTPPAPNSKITMRFGTFPATVKLEAYDGATLVYTQTLNTGNTYQKSHNKHAAAVHEARVQGRQ